MLMVNGIIFHIILSPVTCVLFLLLFLDNIFKMLMCAAAFVIFPTFSLIFYGEFFGLPFFIWSWTVITDFVYFP